MDNVIQFPLGDAPPAPNPETPAGEPNPNLIEQIEHLLEWAKKGDVIAAAFVLVYAGENIVGNGYIDVSLPRPGNFHQLLSGASSLQWRLASTEYDG